MSNTESARRKDIKLLLYNSEVIKVLIQASLGLGLLGGGIVLLALKIPGWSIIFGLPMVVISTIFIIYTYDDILSKHYENSSEEEGEDKHK